jgi:hypothetical protein
MNLTENSSLASVTYINWLNTLSIQMNFYFGVIALPIGLVLDIFSLYIYTKPSLNKTNMGFLYFWQALADILVMLLSLFLSRSRELFDVNLPNYSEFLCKFNSFARRYLVHLSSWMNVIACFDRFIFVLYPSSSKFMKRKLNLFGLIMAMFATLALLNIHNLFSYLMPISVVQTLVLESIGNTSRSNQSSTKIIVGYNCIASPFVLAMSSFVSIILRTAVPFIVMAVLNVMIVRRLRANKRKVQASTTSTPSVSKREHLFTRVVLSLNLLFFLFNFPMSVSITLNLITTYFVRVDALAEAGLSFFTQVALNFSLLYQAMYFFITFKFNSVFRREVLAVFYNKREQADSVLQSSVHSIK